MGKSSIFKKRQGLVVIVFVRGLTQTWQWWKTTVEWDQDDELRNHQVVLMYPQVYRGDEPNVETGVGLWKKFDRLCAPVLFERQHVRRKHGPCRKRRWNDGFASSNALESWKGHSHGCMWGTVVLGLDEIAPETMSMYHFQKSLGLRFAKKVQKSRWSRGRSWSKASIIQSIPSISTYLLFSFQPLVDSWYTGTSTVLQTGNRFLDESNSGHGECWKFRVLQIKVWKKVWSKSRERL